MWRLDYKESSVPKNWCFWTVVLEKTLESPLDCKKIQPIHSKGSQSWIIIGRTDCWSWNSNALATWCEELTRWKRLMLGKVEGGRRRGWERMRWLDGNTDSMKSSLVNSGSWWWTVRPGVLQSLGSQRVTHNSLTELNWTFTSDSSFNISLFIKKYRTLFIVVLCVAKLLSAWILENILSCPHSWMTTCLEKTTIFQIWSTFL